MTKSSEFSLSETGAEAGINALFRAAQTTGAAFSAWRLPNQEELFISICFGAETISENFALEKAPAGFIMHPFEIAPQNQACFLPSGLLFSSNLQQNTITGRQLTENPKATQFRETLRQELEAPFETNWYTSSAEIKATNRAAFEDLVKNAISFLKKGEAEKVVPSRCANVSLPLHFTPVTGFLSLLKKYPQAFVSLVSAPETGTWLGASPEILVQKDRQNIFRTMALAGTQKMVSGQNQADAIWRQKEIEEQSLVVRYIISCFKKIRLREYIETGPRTVAAGNLLHLRSDFCVDLNEQTAFPDLTTQMLHLLHP
ncbi:MAG TPA: chorismate-binding protein, partial [Adhaeribacter sp.]|nr:chorismate-binding protein [Adhaeribacter sp.]